MKSLDELREQIDDIDARIIELLDSRYKLTDDVAVYKNAHNIALTDETREQELIQRLKQKATHPALKEYIDDIYSQIISLNKKARLFNRAATMPFKRIGVIGLGFIGGSIIKALKAKSKDVTVATVKRDSKDFQYGIDNTYFDTVYDSVKELAEEVDLLILATPIAAIPELVDEIKQADRHLPLTVMDVASVKETIGALFEDATSDMIQFVPTHPMAGSEKTGFQHAQAMAFVNKPWALTLHNRISPETADQVRQVIAYFGSSVVEVTPAQHDIEVAAVSHIVFMVSIYLFAFMNNLHKDSLQLAGSGFETMTRLASGSPEMHAQIIQNNHANIEVTMLEFVSYLAKCAISKDGDYEFFKETKSARDTFMQDRTLDTATI